jgi:hypothetical protein
LVFLCSVILGALVPSITRADAITQTDSIPLTATDFGQTSPTDLVIQQFNTEQGTRVLDGVDVTVHALIQNNFGMTFVTPATITESVATNNPSSPGPTVTIEQPNGTTPLLTVQSPNDPAFLTRTVTYGGSPGQTLPQHFGSDLPTTSPNYLAPAISQQTASLTLTDAADLAKFTGTSAINLPVVASAIDKATISSGNGTTQFTTDASATVTITYQYHEVGPQTLQTVPEAGSLALWGLGLLAGARIVRRYRRHHGPGIEGSPRS